MHIQIETFISAITSHEKQTAKYQTYRKNSNSSTRGEITRKVSSEKKHPETVDTDNQTFSCDNADGHSQTGNQKISASTIRKQQEALRDFVYTPSRIYHLFFTCILDFTDKKS